MAIIIMTIFTIVFIYVLDTQLLGIFYTMNKQETLYDAFVTICDANERDVLYTDDYQVEFEKLCSNKNIQIMVMTADGEIQISSLGENDIIRTQLHHLLFGNNSMIYSGENYSIEKAHDDRMNGDYLILWGTIPDNNIIVIRTAVASINDSVRLSNRFLLIAGTLSVVLAMLIASILSGLITRPIKELTNISEKMEQLDFEAKYRVREHPNEIDVLGERMNHLSETLEDTIGALRSANSDLERDLKVRTENENMRREFLANVSHELKTPLALIKGYAEGLSESVNEDEESRRFYCDVITDEADRMNLIVMQLLSLNQIEFGQQAIHQERFNISEMIRGVIDKNMILLKQGDIKARFESEKDYYVWSDIMLTEQVISNYFSNAIHHVSNENEIVVRIEENDKDIKICVFNTGENIPEESIPHLFEKFYKVDAARTREYGGSGIGLSIVKAVVDSLGKECGVQNRTNGVEFWVTFDK